jgi:hypothetical protein
VAPWTIGNVMCRSGSRSETKFPTSMAPSPPWAVSQCGLTRYRRSRKSAELFLAPKPLSGIAQKVPSRLSIMPENPGMT